MWKWFRSQLEARPLMTTCGVMAAFLLWFLGVSIVGGALSLGTPIMVALFLMGCLPCIALIPICALALIRLRQDWK